MRTRVLGALGAVTLGILGGAVALATPAAAVAPPTVAWASTCDGKVQAVITAPADATDADPVWVKIGDTNAKRLPTTTGEKTATVKVATFAPVTATWAQTANSAYKEINAPATYTWDAKATGCVAEVKTTPTTCENPYISVGISNPVGAPPIVVTLNGSTFTVNGGENAALDNTSDKIVWAWASANPALADHGFKGNGTLDYVPPKDCVTGQPGAGPVKPSDGKRHHGKGHYQHVILVPVSDGGTGGGQAQGNGTKGGDTLPVTGTSTLTIAIAGTCVAIVGAIALYLGVIKRRRVRFTAQ